MDPGGRICTFSNIKSFALIDAIVISNYRQIYNKKNRPNLKT